MAGLLELFNSIHDVFCVWRFVTESLWLQSIDFKHFAESHPRSFVDIKFLREIHPTASATISYFVLQIKAQMLF